MWRLWNLLGFRQRKPLQSRFVCLANNARPCFKPANASVFFSAANASLCFASRHGSNVFEGFVNNVAPPLNFDAVLPAKRPRGRPKTIQSIHYNA